MTRYAYNTAQGLFVIFHNQGLWHIWFDGEVIDGNYHTAQGAAEDLANGHCAWPSFGDPSALGIPEDLDEWMRA